VRLGRACSSSFAEATSISFDTRVGMLLLTPGAGQWMTANVAFMNVQASDKGPNGDMCDNWDTGCALTPPGNSWRIDDVLGHNGAPNASR
jgi:serine protease Do